MVVARSRKELFDYVPLADRKLEPEKRTTFHLRRLDTTRGLKLRDVAAGSVNAPQGAIATALLRAGVAGWTNFLDPDDGSQVTCKHDPGKLTLCGIEIEAPLSIECVNLLSLELAAELAGAVMTGNVVTDDDVGN